MENRGRKIEIVCIDNCMPVESIYSSRGIGKCKKCGKDGVQLGKIIKKNKK